MYVELLPLKDGFNTWVILFAVLAFADDYSTRKTATALSTKNEALLFEKAVFSACSCQFQYRLDLHI